jgi:3-hydroxyacyl-CoA dehydrogenase/enoyl-CoA hydratase/3-hydroxybutyryl-CoA epimerase
MHGLTVDAAQRLMREGRAADTGPTGAGVIFDTGFAPYTGGPMNYLQSGER